MVWYFEEGDVRMKPRVISTVTGTRGTLKGMVWNFEEGRVVFCSGWCASLKRLVQ